MRDIAAVAVATLLLAGPARAEDQKPAAPPTAEPAKAAAAAPAKPSAADTERSLYAVGLSVAKSLEPFALTEAELAIVLRGIKDAATGKAAPLDEKGGQAIQDLVQQRLAAAAERERIKGEDSLKKAAAEKGAVKTGSGLVFLALKEGSGAQPTATDKVKVHYTGTLTSGKVFDSSVQRGQPAEFPLNQVIPCWTEGVQKLKVGGKAKLTCPAAIAYGPGGRPPVIPGNAVLVFEVELLGLEAGTPAPVAPAPAK
jgi:FKBP-type peptidyl-prolyl cis-trans isomerase